MANLNNITVEDMIRMWIEYGYTLDINDGEVTGADQILDDYDE